MIKKIDLLPSYFKIVGITVIALAYIIPIILGMMQVLPQLSAGKVELSKAAFIIGLFLIACTKEKTEDGFVTNCRLRSLFYAFTISLCFFVVFTIFPSLAVKQDSSSGFRVILMQLACYLVYFHISIRSSRIGGG